VTFVPLDARELQRRYQALRTGVEKEFVFQNRIPLPEIDRVSESHLGFVSAKDLLDLLSGDDGSLLSTVFTRTSAIFRGNRLQSTQRLLSPWRAIVAAASR